MAKTYTANAKWLKLLSMAELQAFVSGAAPCSHHKRIICDREVERRKTSA